MDKQRLQTIWYLIRTDLITMNGGKNNMRGIFIFSILFFGVIGFLFSPLIGLYVPLILGCFFVPMVFQNELKYHSEKMYAILPVDRKTLVQARFTMCFVLHVVLSVLFWLLMLLAQRVKVFYAIMGTDAEQVDLIKLLSDGLGISENGTLNLFYAIAFAFSMMIMASNLRKYFKDSSKFAALTLGGIKKAEKKEYVYVALLIGIPVLLALVISGAIPLSSALIVVLQFALQLATAADGVLLCLMLLTVAVCSAIYKYICTELEYEEKEL